MPSKYKRSTPPNFNRLDHVVRYNGFNDYGLYKIKALLTSGKLIDVEVIENIEYRETIDGSGILTVIEAGGIGACPLPNVMQELIVVKSGTSAAGVLTWTRKYRFLSVCLTESHGGFGRDDLTNSSLNTYTFNELIIDDRICDTKSNDIREDIWLREVLDGNS
jgi:hypothetical protein